MFYSDVKIKKLNEKAIIPTYGSNDAAGADLPEKGFRIHGSGDSRSYLRS